MSVDFSLNSDFPSSLKLTNLSTQPSFFLKNCLIGSASKNSLAKKIIWIEDINTNNSYPTIFLANEFFDALPIKQFFKKKEGWVERFVNFKEEGKAEFFQNYRE